MTTESGRRVLRPVSDTVEQALALAIQRVMAGPFSLASGTASGGKTFNVRIVPQDSYVPSPQDIIVLPSHGIEKYVAAVGSYSSNSYPITIEDSNGLSAKESINFTTPQASVTGGEPNQGVVLVYFMRPEVYMTEGGVLRQYTVEYDSTLGRQVISGTGVIVADGMETVDPLNPSQPFTPFRIPAINASGAPDSTSIAAVNIVTNDPRTNNLNYAATSMYINSKIPPARPFRAGRGRIHPDPFGLAQRRPDRRPHGGHGGGRGLHGSGLHPVAPVSAHAH